jgi:hypothetical protein
MESERHIPEKQMGDWSHNGRIQKIPKIQESENTTFQNL